jgi:hypothetical protein
MHFRETKVHLPSFNGVCLSCSKWASPIRECFSCSPSPPVPRRAHCRPCTSRGARRHHAPHRAPSCRHLEALIVVARLMEPYVVADPGLALGATASTRSRRPWVCSGVGCRWWRLGRPPVWWRCTSGKERVRRCS